MSDVIILGGGMTRLAAGIATGYPVYVAEETPGGICASYYMVPGDRRRHSRPRDGAYRFELGGGHWIFGGDSAVLRFVRHLVPLKAYERRSAVYLPDRERLIPYPIQHHLRHLEPPLAARALEEIVDLAGRSSHPRTMPEWLRASFGPTLCEVFFDPFHRLYTAGLWQRTAPQDAYKSPVGLRMLLHGALHDPPPVGYNVTFVYPADGLDALAQRMAARCQVTFGKRAAEIDLQARPHPVRRRRCRPLRPAAVHAALGPDDDDDGADGGRRAQSRHRGARAQHRRDPRAALPAGALAVRPGQRRGLPPRGVLQHRGSIVPARRLRSAPRQPVR